MESYCVVTFQSVSHALRFEKLFMSLGKELKLIPVPRVISSSCGIAARLPTDMLSELESVFLSGQADLEKVYLFSGEGKSLNVSPCRGPWDDRDNEF